MRKRNLGSDEPLGGPSEGHVDMHRDEGPRSGPAAFDRGNDKDACGNSDMASLDGEFAAREQDDGPDYLTSSGVLNSKAAAPSSGWTSLLKEVGTTASGMTLAVSFEGRKNLKYCITWLQYAIAHKEHRISVLRTLIDEMRHDKHKFIVPVVKQLVQIQTDITNIIRSVIAVASRYASDALPEYAFRLVRQILFSLPQRWTLRYHAMEIAEPRPAHSKEGTPVHSMDYSVPTSPVSSTSRIGAKARECDEMYSPEVEHDPEEEMEEYNPNIKYERTAIKILTLAVESLDIISSVAQVFRDVVDRADSWAERLHLTKPIEGGQDAPKFDPSSSTSSLPAFGQLPTKEAKPSMEDEPAESSHPSKRLRSHTRVDSSDIHA